MLFSCHAHFCEWKDHVPTASCLKNRCRCCCLTDDWRNGAHTSPLRTKPDGVSRRLEMQRQIDEISAVQCRTRELAETRHNTKGASCEEAKARLQSTETPLGGTSRCPRPKHLVDKTIIQEHAVAHRDENARADRPCDLEWMSKESRVMMRGLEEFSLFVNGMVGFDLSRQS